MWYPDYQAPGVFPHTPIRSAYICSPDGWIKFLKGFHFAWSCQKSPSCVHWKLLQLTKFGLQVCRLMKWAEGIVPVQVLLLSHNSHLAEQILPHCSYRDRFDLMGPYHMSWPRGMWDRTFTRPANIFVPVYVYARKMKYYLTYLTIAIVTSPIFYL